MPTKRINKSKNSPENRARSKRFLWHLEAPWRDKFSHNHWWIEREELICIESAMWEVFRRHPDVPAILQPYAKLTDLEPQMRELERTRPDLLWFERLDMAANQSGLALGGTGYFLSEALCKSWQELAGGSFGTLWNYCLYHRLPHQFGVYESAVSEFKSSVPNRVEQCEKDGKILLEIDLLAPNIGERVEEYLRIRQKMGRQRPEAELAHLPVDEWLRAISLFEKEELNRESNQIRSDAHFASYRRILDKWCWTSDQNNSDTIR